MNEKMAQKAVVVDGQEITLNGEKNILEVAKKLILKFLLSVIILTSVFMERVECVL